ncbi:MAG: DEAD/DEAH box helicase [Candidatus Omnitrophica bacterium]|nr:DEAD/DEAH box helicase [Candidatus Omnitrophota bacterium]MCM8799685.1 DEAD/DEAH box helicase [Candidatus Omnitrophota bacterium]
MEYDRFQKEAIKYIEQGYSVVVCAPTGSGKTAIAEYIIQESIKNDRKVIYTAPIKALSNQKFRDFSNQFKEKIGILTGDVSINPSAPILIMTTEIFRNKILTRPDELKNYYWVIFDEVHYIDNEERGTVWEEALMFLPKHMNILCLSATIPNIEEFASWIESIHQKPLKVVIEDKRPVPLKFFFQCKNEIVENINGLKKLLYLKKEHKPNKLFSLIKYLRDTDKLPCIYFVFGRRKAEDLAFELYSFDFLKKDEKQKIISLYNELCECFNLKGEESTSRLSYLIPKGIAYHHAGMLPTLKEVVEQLFTSRLIKVIFTTETFALGINMPARTVVFDELHKFYGKYSRLLKVRDFYQMAGRAGRRNLDKEGFVSLRINPGRINLEEIKRLLYGNPEEVKSQFNSCYATLLNLYECYKEKLLDIYPLSLHYFQSSPHKKKEALRLIEAKLNLLKELGYIKDQQLSPKGKFASSLYSYELILAELYKENILEELDEFGLGVLATAVVFEPRKNQRILKISRNSQKIKEICLQIMKRIKQKEIHYRIYPFSKEPYFHLASSTEAWLRGTEFNKILQFTDTDEGELIRYFRMAVQILREIKESTLSSSLLKEKVSKVIRVLNRDLVDAEKQLRLA